MPYSSAAAEAVALARSADPETAVAACRRLAALTGLDFHRLLEGGPTICEHCGSITTRIDLTAVDLAGPPVLVCELCHRGKIADSARYTPFSVGGVGYGPIMFENTKAFSGFSVNDIPAAKRFYSEVLGLPVTERNGMLTLHIAGDRDIIVYPKPNHQPATYTILNFPVTEDLEGTVKQLADRGVVFEKLDGVDDDGIFRKGGPHIAWFKDPAGNWLAVLQES